MALYCFTRQHKTYLALPAIFDKGKLLIINTFFQTSNINLIFSMKIYNFKLTLGVHCLCIVQIIMIDVSKVKKRRTNKIARNNWYFILFYRQEGVWCVELARDIWYPLSETILVQCSPIGKTGGDLVCRTSPRYMVSTIRDHIGTVFPNW